MTPHLKKAIIEKKLFVQKAGNVQGSVHIHFPDPKIEDIILNDRQAVNIFGRIGMSEDQIKMSNLSELVRQGHIKILK